MHTLHLHGFLLPALCLASALGQLSLLPAGGAPSAAAAAATVFAPPLALAGLQRAVNAALPRQGGLGSSPGQAALLAAVAAGLAQALLLAAAGCSAASRVLPRRAAAGAKQALGHRREPPVEATSRYTEQARLDLMHPCLCGN